MIKQTNNYTHSLFPYPAKFPPEPIKDIIENLSNEGDSVLDPFCGSGTVLVESILRKRSVTGIELNPVGALVSRAKSRIYKKSQLASLDKTIEMLAVVERERDSWIEQVLSSKAMPAYKNMDHWFQPNMVEELAAIRSAILTNPAYNSGIHDLLWMAFLKIIVPVSNQESETRYAAIVKPEIHNGYAIKKFRQTISEYRATLKDSLPVVKDLQYQDPKVYEGDTLATMATLSDSMFDLVVTSPPYINTFDYYLYHKHRIFWLGKDPQLIRKSELGCHHRIDTMTYVRALNEYRDYLLGVFTQIRRTLRPKKHVFIMIGDGIVKGQVIDSQKLVANLAQETGFRVEDISSVGLRQVSSRFIKDERIDRKNHHFITLKRK